MAADQTYYSIAVLLIATAFIHEAPRRGLIFSAEERLNAIDQAKTLQRKREYVKNLKDNERAFLDGIQAAMSRVHELWRLKSIQSDCQKFELNHTKVFTSLDPKRAWGGLIAARNRDSDMIEQAKLDEKGFECLHAIATVFRDEWVLGKNIQSFEGYVKIHQFVQDVANDYIQAGPTAFWIATVNEDVIDHGRILDPQQRMREIDDQIEALAKADKQDTQPSPPSDDWFRVRLGKLMLFYWPFALVALLGLKLARSSK